MLYRLVKALVAALARLFFRVEVAGTEHIPPSGPALIVSNHASVLDPPIIGAVTPRPLHFLAKAELFSVPLFGRLIAALHSLPVKRESGDAGALRAALRALADGQAVLIFPEGTRSTDGTLGEGKAGGGMLAVLSRAPVVPAYIEGTNRILPRGRALPRPGRIRVRFGPVLRFAEAPGSERKEHYRETSRQMMAAIARLKAETEARFHRPHVEAQARATEGSSPSPPAVSAGGPYTRR